MTVTGNEFEMHEKVECYVCGRPGFMRFDDGPRVLHAYTPPCVLFRPPPPKPPKPKTARDRIAEIQARAA